jgi:hypothetical protein
MNTPKRFRVLTALSFKRSIRVTMGFKTTISIAVLLYLIVGSLSNAAWGAISFDIASSSTGTTSTSHSHTLAAGANAIIVCVGSRESGGSPVPASAVTVGGEVATKLDSQAFGVMNVDLWYKLTPLTGAQTIAATGGAGTDHMVTGAMSFTGVAQTSTFNTVGKVTSATTNLDVDSLASAVGEVGVFCGTIRDTAADSSAASADATAPTSTERFDTRKSVVVSTHGYTEDGAATSINMRVDIVTPSGEAAAVAVSMRAAATRRPIAPILLP